MNETPQQNQPPAQQVSVPEPPKTPESPQRRSSIPKSPYFYALLTFLLGIGVGYLLVTQFPGQKKAALAEPQQQPKTELALPAEAADLKTCVDKKGQFFAETSSLPNGPIFLVDANKVVGLEYVLSQEEFEKGKVYDNLAALKLQIDHMQVASIFEDYNGKPGKYYVVDLFVVDKKTQEAIKCQTPVPTVSEASPSASVNIFPSAVVSQIPSQIPSPSTLVQPSGAAN